MAKKNDNFWHLPKHRFIKKPVLLQPPFWPKMSVFYVVCFETENLEVEQKHNLKWGNSKDKKKELERKKKTENQKKEKILMKKKLAI